MWRAMKGARLWLLIALGSGLAGCLKPTAAIDIHQDIDAPATFSKDLPVSGLNENWWEGYSDPALTELVVQGLEANFDLAASAAILESRGHLLFASKRARWPDLALSGTGSVRSDQAARSAVSTRLGGVLDLDFSGRLAAQNRIASADYAEADYLLADRRRIVAASIVSQYIEYRRSVAALELTDDFIAIQRQSLEFITRRATYGFVSRSEVNRAAADLARTEADRGNLEIDIADALGDLAILTGQQPISYVVKSTVALPKVPEFKGGPPMVLPARLLRRRPDILASEARLIAASAQIDVRRSALRPSFTIPGSISLSSGSNEGLINGFFGSLTGVLNIPLLGAGARSARVRAAEADRAALFAQYQQTFLDALREVERALTAIDNLSARRSVLADAVLQSDATLQQSQLRYREGLAPLTDLLDAQRRLIESRLSAIENDAALAGAYAVLYSSIGEPGLPEPADVR